MILCFFPIFYVVDKTSICTWISLCSENKWDKYFCKEIKEEGNPQGLSCDIFIHIYHISDGRTVEFKDDLITKRPIG